MSASALRRRLTVPAEQLIADHVPLVRKLAWHVHARVASAIDIEELVQIGLLALVEAAQGYEDRGFEFATYASMRIKGAMIDGLRRQSLAGREAAGKRRRIEAAEAAVEARECRAATAAEVAAELDLPLADFLALRNSVRPTTQVSIEDTYSDHDRAFADERPSPEDWLHDERTRHMVAAAIATLPQRDQLVMQLYFVEELNLDEIGKVLDVSAARVCQIKAAALKTLRGKLTLSA